MKHRYLVLLTQILLIVGFLLLWEYLSTNNIINSFIFSSPTKIIKTTTLLFTNYHLINHILVTLKEIVIAFTIGITFGLIIAIIMYEIPFIAKVMEPFLTIINSLPKVALGPIIIIWFGANGKAIIVMALLINLILSIITIYNGFMAIDHNQLLLFKTFKASRYDILTKLVLRGSMDSIIASLKINISMTLIGVIMGEFLVSKAGIGYLIIYGTQIFNLNIVMSSIMVLVILSTLLYYLVNNIKK